MTISLSEAGKRFNREWIFRKFTYTFNPAGTYAITGPNGSGKSTLLQAIAGAIHLSEGQLTAASNGDPIEAEQLFRHLSFAAPYLDLVEEMTALELLAFHASFKPFLQAFDAERILTHVGLSQARHKQIRYFSSGMKQRLKLGQAIFSDTAILLLDEPFTNLDAAGIAMFQETIREYCNNRMLIISSNDPQEYSNCRDIIRITDYKS
ncbi:ABC transporter ATP-binding protein [Flavihumibacter petaseus]|uniref:Putative ABC transporter ATP-binding protein n=1 Tax=Flavihumibacter petaseus NBRC 106054 TaxID=1220578 RepID=A0A0E9N6R2_9BACT|nr:ABC transporter ATP-binding protein [Flavihumibacter petaseus]GAO45035.1 putative ABC transporter ATP-binding protein [Flavihumibacter petaseus NBRC 106054]